MTDIHTNGDHPGLLFVLSGPSGVGKTTITHAILDRFDAKFSVSATTRPISDMEKDGQDYQFIDEDRFRGLIEAGEFLEHARVFDWYYGSLREPVEATLAQGRIMILEIDVQGAIQVRGTAPEAFMVFIMPPSEEALLQRLRDRSREDESQIQRRFREATREMRAARESGVYDCFVVNDDLDQAIWDVCEAIEGELARRRCGG